MRRAKQRKKPVDDKVTTNQLFKTHVQIIKELYQELPAETSMILLLSLNEVAISFLELKLLEFVTNSAADYLGGIQRDFMRFGLTVALLFLFLIVLRLISNLKTRLTERYQNKIVFLSEQKLIRKLSSISYEYYESNEFHEKINLAQQACGQYTQAVFGVTEICRITVMLVVYGFVLCKINLLFALVIMVLIIVSAIISTSVTDKQLDYWRTYVSPESRRGYYFGGVFGNRIQQASIQLGRSFSYFSDKYAFYNKRERKNYLKLNMLSFSSELTTSLLFLMTFATTALVIGRGVAEGTMNIGFFSMTIAMVINLFGTIKSFSLTMMNENWYVRVLNAYYEVLQFDETTSKILISTQDDTNISNGNIISIHNLKYIYPQSERCALNGVSANFHMGEKIALVGTNGSGKTTLISVVLGLLSKFDGEVNYSNAFATAVLQDFGQYQMSIKENIEIGCGGRIISDERTWEIIRAVGLEETVSKLPEGIYTKLGQLESGIELSKGQWQRLAIGRLLADSDANVWILDEPTAYLDPIAEVDMYKLIFALSGKRLVFFISHRLGFARMADRVVVVDNGKIVEDGNHKDLMNKDGLYKSMYISQKEWYV